MGAAESVCLVLEFSGKTASVAVIAHPFTTPTCLAQSFSEGRNHLEQALTMIESTLASAQKTLSDLTELAVPSGPGSFTGLRVGLATAKGLARRLQIPIHTVSAAEMRGLRVAKGPLRIEVFTPASSQRATRSVFEPQGDGLKLLEETVMALADLPIAESGTVRVMDEDVLLTAEVLGLGLKNSHSRKTYATEEARALIDAEYFGTRF